MPQETQPPSQWLAARACALPPRPEGRGFSRLLVILVSSLHRVDALGLPFVFTDMHAYYPWATFHTDLTRLDGIDWPLLQRRDFRRDPDDPARFERYQAEALVHRHLPLDALLGIVCSTDAQGDTIRQTIAQRGLTLPVHARPNWYFR